MSKSNNLFVKISKKTANGVEIWEGTATLPGLAPTKVMKAKTEESKFSTRSTLVSAAQRLATRYGFSDVKFEGVGVEKPKTDKKTQRIVKRREETSLVDEVVTA